MRSRRLLTCVWPGLAELWQQGSWSGLALAISFAVLLNGALAASLVWTDCLSDDVRFAAWAAVGSFWLLGALSAWRQTRIDRHGSTRDLFSRAVNEYLQGNLVAAETSLEAVLRKDRRDVDARLMLVTLYRRTRRVKEARQMLQRLQSFREASKWEAEIKQEIERLSTISVEQVGQVENEAVSVPSQSGAQPPAPATAPASPQSRAA